MCLFLRIIKRYYEGIEDINFNQQDSNAFNNYLVKNNAYYYISIFKGLNLTSYTPIKQFGYVTIYRKKYLGIRIKWGVKS